MMFARISPTTATSEATEQLVYRTCLEAVSNTRKHAAARTLTITLRDGDGAVIGEVADDGCGFDVSRALRDERLRLHLGLDAMTERVRVSGGELQIESAPGRGTAVRFTVPGTRRPRSAAA